MKCHNEDIEGIDNVLIIRCMEVKQISVGFSSRKIKDYDNRH